MQIENDRFMTVGSIIVKTYWTKGAVEICLGCDLYFIVHLIFILRTAYCIFYIVCFYSILGLLFIFYMYINFCRILLI